MRPLVIGVGNRWRTDDGIGPRVAEALDGNTAEPGLDTTVLDGEPARLMAAWEGRPLVVVIDAVRTGAAPGTIHRIDALEADLPSATSSSTHGVGVAGAVALARSLDRLPEQLVVIGVEPGSLDHGADLSPAVAAVFDDVVRRTVEEVSTPCA